MKYSINFSSANKVKRKQIYALRVAYGISVIFLAIIFILGINRVGSISSEIERIKIEKTSIEEMIEKNIKERRRFISDEEIKVLNEKVRFYKDIYEKRFFVTLFLTDLESIMVSATVLKSLDIDIVRKNFILVGESLNPESAVAFSKRLQGINYIKKAEITKQTFQRFGEKKILVNDFEIRGDLY